MSDVRTTNSFYDYLFFRILMIFFAISAISIITIASVKNNESIAFVFFFGIGKALESIGDIAYGILQKEGLVQYTGMSQLFKGLIILFSFIFIPYLKIPTVTCGFIYVVLILFVTIFYDLKIVTKRLPQLFNVKDFIRNVQFANFKSYISTKWISILKVAMPMGVIGGLLSYGSTTSRYFISFLLDYKELAVFTSLFYIYNVGTQIAIALGEASITSLTYTILNNKNQYKRTTALFFIILLMITLVTNLLIVAIGEETVKLIYGINFIKYMNVLHALTIMFPLACMNLYFYNTTIIIRKAQKTIWIYVLQILILVLSCIFFIPSNGLLGAVIAQILSYFIQNLVLFWVINNYLFNEELYE